MTGRNSLMQRRRVRVVALRVVPVGILSGVEQHADDVHVTVLRGQSERPMAVLAGRTGEQLTRLVETAQSGGRGDVVYARAAADERLGRVAETKRQRRHQGRRPRAGAFRFERGAEIDEHVDERRLHACLRRRRARHEHAQRRAFAAIHVRKSVDLGAGLQQHRRDGHGIGRRFLTVAFDAVRRDVVQQGIGRQAGWHARSRHLQQ